MIRELSAPRPFLNLRLLLRGNFALIMLVLVAVRFIILSTAYITPTYLQAVQNFRELQVGQVLSWIAMPHFIIVVPLALLLRRMDGRYVLSFGIGLVGTASLMTAQITSSWASQESLPSQILQAVGQSFALTALTVLTVRSIVPEDALSIGCRLQVSRLFGGEIGTAFMQTFIRRREQFHSNVIGQHVIDGPGLTFGRLEAYAVHAASRVADAGVATDQAHRFLAAAITNQANVLAYQDGFIAATIGAVLCLVLVAPMRRAGPSPF